MFLLTGLPPEVKKIDQDVKVGTASTRIILYIDPLATPKDVSEAYARFRKEVLPRRFRNMSDKHLRLAAFVAECPDNQSWREKMDAWNESYGQITGYGYINSRLFWRDAEQAQRRLLYGETN